MQVEDYYKYKYYLEYDLLLEDIKKNISYEMTYIYHKILYTDPCYYWNKEVFKETINLLDELYSDYNSELSMDEDIFNYYLMGYNSYFQLTEIIKDLRNFNISTQVKTRFYSIPTYTSILEGCQANFYRVIALLLGQAKGKDYASQNTLGKLVNVLNSNGFNILTRDVNVNIRNAINHGKVIIKRKDIGEKICFYYVENRRQSTLELSTYEFDELIDKAYNTASSVFLGITTFLNKHMDLLDVDTGKKGYVQFSLLSMRLSLPNEYIYQ